MSPLTENSTGTIQFADDSIYPVRKVPSPLSDKLSRTEDVEVGGDPNMYNEDFSRKKKQARFSGRG